MDENLDRLANQKVKGGALIMATTVYHQRHMIRVKAVVCDMAAERRSLDFGGQNASSNAACG